MRLLLWLRIEPLPAFAFQQRIGFARTPASRRVLRNAGGFRRAPYIQNRIDQRPRRLDAVSAVEQRGISAHAIAEQRGVCAPRSVSKAFAVTEIHSHIADAHVRPWLFRSK